MSVIVEIQKPSIEEEIPPPLPEKDDRKPKKQICHPVLGSFLGLLFFVALIAIFFFFALKSSSFLHQASKIRRSGFVNVSDLPTDFIGLSTKGSETDIGSWFNCNENEVHGITSGTNGNSWCGYPYNDTMVGFAISIIKMCGTAQCQYYDGPRYQSATSKYCGLEAWVYNPRTGKNVTAVVLDAFAPQYLEDMGHTAGSIDATPALFTLLGESPIDKMTVIYGVQFDFTGRRDLYYAA